MPVTGPVGVRTMNWVDGKDLCSPVKSHFKWRNKIQWAECGCKLDHEITPPYDPDEFPEWPRKILRMSWDSNCGIWASTDILIVHANYADYESSSVLFLVEALGSIMMYTYGWRASGIEIIAVVRPQFFKDKELLQYYPHEMRMQAASKRYNVPIIKESVAEQAIYQMKNTFNKDGKYDIKHGETADPYKT